MARGRSSRALPILSIEAPGFPELLRSPAVRAAPCTEAAHGGAPSSGLAECGPGPTTRLNSTRFDPVLMTQGRVAPERSPGLKPPVGCSVHGSGVAWRLRLRARAFPMRFWIISANERSSRWVPVWPRRPRCLGPPSRCQKSPQSRRSTNLEAHLRNPAHSTQTQTRRGEEGSAASSPSTSIPMRCSYRESFENGSPKPALSPGSFRGAPASQCRPSSRLGLPSDSCIQCRHRPVRAQVAHAGRLLRHGLIFQGSLNE
jgi:hypothetical protein